MKKLGVVLFGVIPALLLPLVGTVLYFFLLADSGYANIVYSATKVFSFIWIFFWLQLIGWKLPDFGMKKNIKTSLFWGAISGILIFVIGFAIFIYFLGYFRQFTPEIEEKVGQMGIQNFYIGFSLIISLIHSLFEEFYWRFFVFRGLMLKFTPLTAGIIASIGFSLHHFLVLGAYFPIPLTVVLGLAVFVGGLIWCKLYQKTATLLGNWLSHACVDIAIFTAGYVLVYR